MSEPASRQAEGAPAPANQPLVIWNSNAGQKKPLRDSVSAAEAAALLSDRGLECEMIETGSADDAVAAAARAVKDGRSLVVAAGGDGTIGAVAGELLGSDTALGILPMGSVMNIPRMLGLPRDLEAAADVLAAGRTRVVDVGVANGQVFYEAASVGLNATIFRAAERFMERDYLSMRRLLWIVLRYRPARIRLELDDETVAARALMVTVSNGPYTGLGMTVAPTARLDDGLFDVRVFRHYSKFELLRHLASITFGRREYTPHSRTYRTANVRIEARRSLPVRVDGVDAGRTPLECHVRRACLRVVVPGAEEEQPGAG